MSDAVRTRAVAAGVAVCVAAPLVPLALGRWWLTQDAIEHLLIAWQWIHGAGFVNPVQWHFYLEASPPLPAFATRAPMISWLLAVPLWLGASIETVGLLHVLLAAAVSGALVLVARRFMSLPAAALAGLLLGLSPAWQFAARFPWTEVAGVAAFLLVLASARGPATSVRGALLCAGVTWLAWLTRANLGALVLAVFAAALWETARGRGLRAALRFPPAWLYVTVFAALVGLSHAWARTSIGIAPYAAYGVALEMFHHRELTAYQKEFVGVIPFVVAHAQEIAAQMQLRVRELFRLLCVEPSFAYVGWLAPVALFNGLRPGAALEARLLAFGALGFGAIVVLTYGGFDPARHGLFTGLSILLGGVAAVDAGVRRMGRRRGSRAIPMAALACGVVFLALVPGPRVIATTWLALAHLQSQPPLRRIGSSLEDHVHRVCPRMEPDALVASSDPWTVAMWCGNPAVVLPTDLRERESRERFLREKRPRYLWTDALSDHAWLRASAHVRPVDRQDSFVLWAVKAQPEAGPRWAPAAPLACAGRSEACAKRLGRSSR